MFEKILLPVQLNSNKILDKYQTSTFQRDRRITETKYHTPGQSMGVLFNILMFVKNVLAPIMTT
jgi:hypothetical protein